MPSGHWEGGMPEALKKALAESMEGLNLGARHHINFDPNNGGSIYVPFQGWNPNLPSNLQVAPVNQKEQLFRALSSQVEHWLPFLQRAQELNAQGSVGFPESAQNYMNPYQEQVSNRIAEMGNRNLNEKILPALEAKFVRLGQHGGRQHREMAGRLARDVQGEISAQQGNLLHQGYGQAGQMFNEDQARKLRAAELDMMLGKTKQASHLVDAAAVAGAGAHEREQEQALINAAREEQERMHNHQIKHLTEAASILHGVPLQGPTFVPEGDSRSMHGSDYLAHAIRGATALATSGFGSQPAGIGETQKPRGHRQGGPIRLNQYAPQYAHGGLVKHEKTGYIRESDSGGQADDIDMAIQPNAYVWNATDVSLLGDGNTETGIKKLKEHEAQKIAEYERKFARSGITQPYDNSHAIKAKVSNGEYVMDARAVCAEGNGDIRKGVKAIDKGRKLLRKQKGVKSILPPKAKNINSYVRGR